MTALRRMTAKSLGGLSAMLALVLGGPVLAQDNNAPIDVTAAPSPSPETIGPRQLRNFSLQGTVTRPADRPTATPAKPANTASAEPEMGDAVPSEAARVPNVREDSRRVAAQSDGVPGNGEPGRPNNKPVAQTTITPSLPLDVITYPAPQPYPKSGALASPTPDSGTDILSLPWIAALIALFGGGAFIVWNRRGRRQRHGELGKMAFSGATPEAIPDPAPTPIPAVRPRPDPLPPRGGSKPAPRPDEVSPTVPKPVDDGLIVSTRLKPQLNVEFHPERVVVTEQDVQLLFEVVLANVGSAAARNILVEGRLFTAHVGQDREIAEFFQNPMTDGDRIAAIPPLGRIALKSVVRLSLADVHRFEAAGREMFVPMIGFNILYRAGSSESQASASFLVGRGGEGDEKLAPFRLDVGPRTFNDLSARAHSIGLQPA